MPKVPSLLLLLNTIFFLSSAHDDLDISLLPVDVQHYNYACPNNFEPINVVDEETLEEIKDEIFSYKYTIKFWNGFECKGLGSSKEMKFYDDEEMKPDDFPLWKKNDKCSRSTCGWFLPDTDYTKVGDSVCDHKDYTGQAICRKDAGDGECDNDNEFWKYDNMCLKLEISIKKEVEMKEQCKKQGAIIIPVKTEEHRKLMHEEIKLGYFSKTWTGVKKKDGKWKNPDGSSVPDAVWASNEPSEDGDCGYISSRVDYKMIAHNCNNVVGFVLCERKNRDRNRKTTTTTTTEAMTTTTETTTTTEAATTTTKVTTTIEPTTTKATTTTTKATTTPEVTTTTTTEAITTEATTTTTEAITTTPEATTIEATTTTEAITTTPEATITTPEATTTTPKATTTTTTEATTTPEAITTTTEATTTPEATTTTTEATTTPEATTTTEDTTAESHKMIQLGFCISVLLLLTSGGYTFSMYNRGMLSTILREDAVGGFRKTQIDQKDVKTNADRIYDSHQSLNKSEMTYHRDSHLMSNVNAKLNEIPDKEIDVCKAKFICRACAKPARYGFSWRQVKRFYDQSRPFSLDTSMYKDAAVLGFKNRSLDECTTKFRRCDSDDSTLLYRYRSIMST